MIGPVAQPLPSSHAQITVTRWRCSAGPGQPVRTELHQRHSLSFVMRGSFGCRCRGRHVDLAGGALFVGHPGDEYTCTHDHHDGGDECLSFSFDADLADRIGGGRSAWHCVALPPLPALGPWRALASAAAEGRTSLALDEIGMSLATRFIRLQDGKPAAPAAREPSARDRRRALHAAAWIEAHCHTPLDLDRVAAEAGSSRYHFLRLFARVVGATPHQYLIGCRLRLAARLLAEGSQPVTAVAFDSGFGDLSNFVRSFARAAGLPPLAYRQRAQGWMPRPQRKILQAAAPPPAEDPGSHPPGVIPCSITSESRSPISPRAGPSMPPP